MTWDTALYSTAHTQVIQCQRRRAEGLSLSSWQYSGFARLAYFGNLAINVASFPLAILFVTFGLVVAISHWDFKIDLYRRTFNWIKTKTNHILLSALGIAFPCLAYRFRNANLAPYVIALRIGVVTWGFFYAFNR